MTTQINKWWTSEWDVQCTILEMKTWHMTAYVQWLPASQNVTSQLSLLRLMLDISWQSFMSLISSAKAARISSNSSRLRVWNFGKRATCNKGNADLMTTPPWVPFGFKDVNRIQNSEPGIKEKSILCQQIFLNVCIDKIQQDATVCRYLFTASLLYTFRASTAPIIRSTINCNRSHWYRS